MTDASSQLRADARENRDRIVAAARALFAERGLSVGTTEIARRAGVGSATLYRRFPTREALVDEAFASEMRACRRIVLRGSSDPDAWRGLRAIMRELVTLSARNRGFVEALQASAMLPSGLIEHRRELLLLLDDLVRRARVDGEVRPDIAVDDLVLLLRAGRGVTDGLRSRGRPAADRFVDLALSALRASR
ncbi:TetR/AcrR family transcriptional regulator [Amnibacterium kyonggiense]|uniref:TetR family transcriptional regulator n=1 Tax=Amnibacterium kyonggiense TaxID=595671 RepID=A0A4R7FQQ1_9MICO|nr:TetR/AcrR family transcriptional regulator [Amnibacterium kyonggiense]TDS80036.1 TetR family transcriptional regulator [Amnibacterium kyonggiense]